MIEQGWFEELWRANGLRELIIELFFYNQFGSSVAVTDFRLAAVSGQVGRHSDKRERSAAVHQEEGGVTWQGRQPSLPLLRAFVTTDSKYHTAASPSSCEPLWRCASTFSTLGKPLL